MRNRNFIILLISQVIGLMGTSMINFATALYVLDLTGSAETFATLIAIKFLPVVIFAPIGGALADRFSKKRMMVIADVSCTLLIGALAVLLFTDNATIVAIAIIGTLLSTISVCYFPVITSALPVIMEKDEQVKVNGVVQVVRSSSRLVAPVVAGFLYPVLGVAAFVAAVGAFYALSAITNIFLKIPYERIKDKANFVKAIAADLKTGFVYIVKKDTRILRVAVTIAVVSMFFEAILSVAIPYVIRIYLDMSEQHLGFAQAAIGAASIVGGLLISLEIVSKWVSYGHFKQWLFILTAVSVPIGIALLPNILSAFGTYLIFVGGFALVMVVFSILNVLLFSSVQKETPKELVGKVSSIIVAIVMSVSPIGHLIIGFLLERAPLYAIFFTITALTLVGVIISRKKHFFMVEAPLSRAGEDA